MILKIFQKKILININLQRLKTYQLRKLKELDY